MYIDNFRKYKKQFMPIHFQNKLGSHYLFPFEEKFLSDILEIWPEIDLQDILSVLEYVPGFPTKLIIVWS